MAGGPAPRASHRPGGTCGRKSGRGAPCGRCVASRPTRRCPWVRRRAHRPGHPAVAGTPTPGVQNRSQLVWHPFSHLLSKTCLFPAPPPRCHVSVGDTDKQSRLPTCSDRRHTASAQCRATLTWLSAERAPGQEVPGALVMVDHRTWAPLRLRPLSILTRPLSSELPLMVPRWMPQLRAGHPYPPISRLPGPVSFLTQPGRHSWEPSWQGSPGSGLDDLGLGPPGNPGGCWESLGQRWQPGPRT